MAQVLERCLHSVLAKSRRVRLELAGRPHLDGLPILVGDHAVQIYQRTKAGQAAFQALALADIDAVWDLSAGACVWRKNETTK
jgi:hypothetical protein